MTTNNLIFTKPKSVRRVRGTSSKFYDITVDDAEHTFAVVANDSFLYVTHNCDGYHISSLLMNLFFKWFPYVITEGRLFVMRVPLMSIEEHGRRYFYDLNEFKTYAKGKSVKELRYLKGLGSLDMKDWEHAMSNKQLMQIMVDDNSKKYMDMAFGADVIERKKWLSHTEI